MGLMVRPIKAHNGSSSSSSSAVPSPTAPRAEPAAGGTGEETGASRALGRGRGDRGEGFFDDMVAPRGFSEGRAPDPSSSIRWTTTTPPDRGKTCSRIVSDPAGLWSVLRVGVNFFIGSFLVWAISGITSNTGEEGIWSRPSLTWDAFRIWLANLLRCVDSSKAIVGKFVC